MDVAELVPRLQQESDGKILFVIVDGLGGLPGERGGSELEIAATPNLDRLARDGATGLLTPVAPGITPGSGPGHLALFGYDPLQYTIGRGVLSALGVDFDLLPNDVAARGNFCTVDEAGKVIDRRAFRISSDRGAQLARILQAVRVEGIRVFVQAVKEHRFLLVLRGEKLGDQLSDTDPQRTGVPPQEPHARDEASKRTADAVRAFVEQARDILADQHPANMILLRGFGRLPELPSVRERYGLKACAFAGYPMYRGIARLLGMEVMDCQPDLESEVDALHAAWEDHDFFFVHYKEPDSRGEDGDFEGKVAAIEHFDRSIPRIIEKRPDVLVVTGDHSTPSVLASHSWHPVPLLLSAATCRRDAVETFGETACARGGLAHMSMKHLMALALAHAGRLRKFGA